MMQRIRKILGMKRKGWKPIDHQSYFMADRETEQYRQLAELAETMVEVVSRFGMSIDDLGLGGRV